MLFPEGSTLTLVTILKKKVNINENTPEPVEETESVETAEYTEIQENGAETRFS